MRTTRFAIAALTFLATIGLAGPAAADHVAEVNVDATACSMGYNVSKIGTHLTTTHFQITQKNGRTTGYVCHFSGLPPRSEWHYEYVGSWTPPNGVHRVSDFWCYTPEQPWGGEAKKSTFIATPSGRATLTCKF